jgi:hypothetical protein
VCGRATCNQREVVRPAREVRVEAGPPAQHRVEPQRGASERVVDGARGLLALDYHGHDVLTQVAVRLDRARVSGAPDLVGRLKLAGRVESSQRDGSPAVPPEILSEANEHARPLVARLRASRLDRASREFGCAGLHNGNSSAPPWLALRSRPI